MWECLILNRFSTGRGRGAPTLRLNAVCCGISSRLHVRVLWWTPERTRQQELKTRQRCPPSLSRTVGSTRTSSCSEEGRCSELDSPPGMLNWDQQPWECRGQPGCYSGSSLIGCQSGSFGFQVGRKSVPKRKKGGENKFYYLHKAT